MRAGWVAAAVLVAWAAVAACGHAQPAGFAVAAPYPPVDSEIYAIRPPLPGRLTYLQSIKFVDDGMKYIDPGSAFYIAPWGEMCFRSLPDTTPSIYAFYYKDWCVYPQYVSRVEAMSNDITNIDEVRLWCVHSAPQCAHRIGPYNALDETGWVANSILVQTVAYREERSALENLIYLMGGNLGAGSAAGLSAYRGRY